MKAPDITLAVDADTEVAAHIHNGERRVGVINVGDHLAINLYEFLLTPIQQVEWLESLASEAMRLADLIATKEVAA